MTPRPPEEQAVLARLSLLDRFLPAWILLAMGIGLGLGRLFPGLNDALDTIKIGSVSLPIALGLLAMMYPVLAKVRYSRVGEVAADRKLMGLSLLLNWVIGPALMFALAWALLPDLPEYRTGLIIVGLARCIAMVLIWNDLACGDREAAVVLVALNSLFQIVAYSLLGYFYLQVLPGWLGLETDVLDVSLWEIAKIVLIFLGIPLRGRLPDPALGGAHSRGGVVRAALPPPHRPLRPVGTAVHRGAALRPAGGDHHRQAARRGPHRPAPAGLLRPHVGGVLRPRPARSAWATRATPRCRSPRPATTSNWPSRWPSGCTGSPPARPWPGWSGR